MTDVGDKFDTERALGPKDGPYGVLNEYLFFERNPGFSSPLLSDEELLRNISLSDIRDQNSPGRNIGFQTEIGSVSHPELESLAIFLSSNALHSFPNCGEKLERGGSFHDEWAYYKYLPFTESNSSWVPEDQAGVDHICAFLFPPMRNDTTTPRRMDSIEDYSWAAQLAQYFQYKAMMEGYSHRMWEWYSAVFLWKCSSPAPTFRGALYDWFLATNGGYWGARAGLAAGSPVRVILNLRDLTVHVVNSLPTAVIASSVRWCAYSLGVMVGNGEVAIPHGRVDGDTVVHLNGSLPWMGKREISLPNVGLVQDVLLYRIELSYQRDDKSVDLNSTAITFEIRNTYYLTDPGINDRYLRQSRFALLGAARKVYPRVNLGVQCRVATAKINVIIWISSALNIECQIQNPPHSTVAIMTKLTLVRDPTVLGNQKDTRILPTFYSDNYMTLLPGETTHVNLSTECLAESNPSLRERTSCECHADGSLKLDNHGSTVSIMVAIDGWNIQKQTIPISCAPSSYNVETTSNN